MTIKQAKTLQIGDEVVCDIHGLGKVIAKGWRGDTQVECQDQSINWYQARQLSKPLPSFKDRAYKGPYYL